MPLLVCPNCESGMQEVNRNGVMIDVCTKCRGVWLDRGELEKLLGEVRRVEQEMVRDYESAYSPPPQHHHHDKHYHHKKKKRFDIFDIFD